MYNIETIYDKPWIHFDRVPRGYWEDDNNVRKALKWLFEEKLDIFKEGTTISIDDFKNNNLIGLLIGIFDGSPIKAIEYMYPGKFKPWEKCSTPKGYWNNDDNIKRALQWLFEEKVDIFKNGTIITTKDFKDNNLLSLFHNHFYNSPYKAIEYMYPGKFKPWEKCGVPRKYWKNDNNIRNALKWLFEEKLDIFDQNTFITISDFKNNNLLGLLNNNFNGIIYKAIKFMYPYRGDLLERCNAPRLYYYNIINDQPSLSKINVPNGYWKNDDNVKEALQWLFEDVLNIFHKNTIITAKDFEKYGLMGLLNRYFGNSIYKAIEYMYSGKFKPWEKCSVPRNYWKNDDNIRNALKWLFEEKLDIFKDGTIITTKDFKDNNLYGLLHNHFNGSTYEAIDYIYPDMFKPWERCSTPRKYWEDMNHVKEALHWLFEEKLDIFKDGTIITTKDFKDNNMYSIVTMHFNSSIYRAIDYMYPGKFKPWEKCGTPREYWESKYNIKKALHWLVDEKGFDISVKSLLYNKLGSLRQRYNIEYLNELYNI